MTTLQLNGFYCGIVTTEHGSEEYINQKRQEWSKEGRVCWITQPTSEYNPECPGGE